MTAPPPLQPTVKSAMRTLDLIEYIVARPSGVIAQEIAEALAIPVSSLSYLLSTLVERTYLHRVGRRYFAGPGLDRLRRPRQEQSLADRARPLVKALRQQTNETSSLFRPVDWDMEAVVTETAEQTLRYSIDVGTRVPLHCLSAGKAFLAAQPDEEVERYLAESRRTRFTPATCCSREDLLREVAETRRAGYARTQDEYTIGISGIGTVVLAAGVPVAALSVAIPSPRFDPAREERIVGQLVKAARALEDGQAVAL